MIEKLKIEITKLQNENEKLEIYLQNLKESFNITNKSEKTASNQKARVKIIKQIYDTYRKIIYNNMAICRYLERIEYISKKGKDVPNQYKEIKFTTDNYRIIDEEKQESKLSLKQEKRGLKAFFESSFFSKENTIKNKSNNLQKEIIEKRNYILAIKNIFEFLINASCRYLSSHPNASGKSLTKELQKYLKSIEINPKNMNLPNNYWTKINTIKEGYINAIISEVEVYEDTSQEDIHLYGNRAILMNHLNIFLGQFIDLQMKQFELENESIRYDFEDKNSIFESAINSLFYLDDLRTNISQSELIEENRLTRRL